MSKQKKCNHRCNDFQFELNNTKKVKYNNLNGLLFNTPTVLRGNCEICGEEYTLVSTFGYFDGDERNLFIGDFEL
jgi:hypothetical protein